MVCTQPLEDFAGGPVGPWIGQRLVYPSTEPLVDCCLLAVEGPQCSPHHFAGRRIGPGLDARLNATIQVAKGDGYRLAGTRHSWLLQAIYDSVILRRQPVFFQEMPR